MCVREDYVRVSTILNYFHEPELVDWMIAKGKDAKKIGKKAMSIGTNVDEAIKEFVATGYYGRVKTIEATNCLDGFKRWYDDYKPTLTVGTRLYLDSLQLTGEPDIYWGQRVIDLKCAGAIRQKYWVQTGIYDFMGSRSLQTAILRLHKHLADYEYKEHNGEEVNLDADCFVNLLNVYNYLLLGEQQGGRDANSITDNKE